MPTVRTALAPALANIFDDVGMKNNLLLEYWG